MLPVEAQKFPTEPVVVGLHQLPGSLEFPPTLRTVVSRLTRGSFELSDPSAALVLSQGRGRVGGTVVAYVGHFDSPRISSRERVIAPDPLGGANMLVFTANALTGGLREVKDSLDNRLQEEIGGTSMTREGNRVHTVNRGEAILLPAGVPYKLGIERPGKRIAGVILRPDETTEEHLIATHNNILTQRNYNMR